MSFSENKVLSGLGIPSTVSPKHVTHVVCEGKPMISVSGLYWGILKHLHQSVTHLTLDFGKEAMETKFVEEAASSCKRLTYLRIKGPFANIAAVAWHEGCMIDTLIYDDCANTKSNLSLPPRLRVLRMSNVKFTFDQRDYAKGGRFQDIEELEANGMWYYSQNEAAKASFERYHEWLRGIAPDDLCEALATQSFQEDLVGVLWDRLYKRALEIVPDHFRFMSPDLISQLFALIDSIFFGSRMGSACRLNAGKCDTSVEGLFFSDTCAKGYETAAGLCTYWTHSNHMELRMTAKMFLDIPRGSTRSANGVDCTSRLSCFLSVLEHEATHALVNIHCIADVKAQPKLEGHTPAFVAIQKQLYGHTEFYHELPKEIRINTPKTVEDALELLELADELADSSIEHSNTVYKYVKMAWPVVYASSLASGKHAEMSSTIVRTFVQARTDMADKMAKNKQLHPTRAIRVFEDSAEFLEEWFPDEMWAVVHTRVRIGDLYALLDDTGDEAIEAFEDALKKCNAIPGSGLKRAEICIRLGDVYAKRSADDQAYDWYKKASAEVVAAFTQAQRSPEWYTQSNDSFTDDVQKHLIRIGDSLREGHPEEAMLTYEAAQDTKQEGRKSDWVGHALSRMGSLAADSAKAEKLFGRAAEAYETSALSDKAEILEQMAHATTTTDNPALAKGAVNLARWVGENGTYAEATDACKDALEVLNFLESTEDFTDPEGRLDTLLIRGEAMVAEGVRLYASDSLSNARVMLYGAIKELKELARTKVRAGANKLVAKAQAALYGHYKDDAHYEAAIRAHKEIIKSDPEERTESVWRSMGDLAISHEAFEDAAKFYDTSAESYMKAKLTDVYRIQNRDKMRQLARDARQRVPKTAIILEINAHTNCDPYIVAGALKLGVTELRLVACVPNWGKEVRFTWNSLTHLTVTDAPFRGMRAIKTFCPNLTHLTLDNALHDWAESDTDTPIRELEHAELVNMYKLQAMDDLGANEEDDEEKLKELAKTFEQQWDKDTESMFVFLDTWRSYTPFPSITHLTLKNVAFSEIGIMHTCTQLTHLTVENVEFPFERIGTYVADVDEDDAWPELKIINVLKPVPWRFPESYTPRNMLDAFNDPLSDRRVQLFIGGAKLEKKLFKSMSVPEVADWIRAQVRDMGITEVEGVVNLFKGVNGDAMEERAFEDEEIEENQFLSQTDAKDLWRRLKLFE